MHVIDSHTGGEPTRVIPDGAPDLGPGTLADRARRLARDHRDFYRSILLEPRGQPAMVGALLVEPQDTTCATGVIFFDVDAVLGMCGHGAIGTSVTLAHLGRIEVGNHRIETPAGVVSVELHDANTVTVQNIESRRVERAIALDVEGYGAVTGDVAYGGNWFFIFDPSPIPIEVANIAALTEFAIAVRDASIQHRIGGENGEEIDHVFLQGPSSTPGMYGRNYVLCPDDAYDRSPCGTGCSAYLSCLAADKRLEPGQVIAQESVIGSSYQLSFQNGANGGVIPSITGQAYVMAESELFFASNDPFQLGIGA